jgi:formiminotetrahydrofolate cyclodeaminase
MESDFFDKPFKEVIELASSKNPTPGGGSVSAMAGVLGASLGSMVANITLGKAENAKHAPTLNRILSIFARGKEQLMKLAQDDMRAFEALLTSYRLPKGTDVEKDARDRAIKKNMVQAVTIPLKISGQSLDLLIEVKNLTKYSSVSVLSDLASAAVLLESAVRSSMIHVDVNLERISHDHEYATIMESKQNFMKSSRSLMEEILELVNNRHETT